MNKARDIPSSPQNEVTNVLTAGYEAAVNIFICEAELCWSRFNAMLVANSVIMALIGFQSNTTNTAFISYVLPIIGIILCLCWRALMSRGFDYHRYYVMSARELEEQLPSSVVKTLSRGAIFASGEPIVLKLGGIAVNTRMSTLSRAVTVDNISKITTSLFIAVYVAALWQFLFFK